MKFSAKLKQGSKIRFSIDGKSLNSLPVDNAQKWLTGKAIHDTAPFVPHYEGILEGSAIRSSDYDKGLIVYDTLYARKLYYGVSFKFSRDKNPQATHHWFEKAASFFFDIWGNGVAKILGHGWTFTARKLP